MIETIVSRLARKQALSMLIVTAALCSMGELAAGSAVAIDQNPFASNPITQDPYLVKDIVTTNQGIGISYDESTFASVDGFLFLGISDGDHGFELWKSDGTETGTYLVKDILPGGSSLPRDMTGINNILYFTAADSEHGRELWRSDGTEVGTLMVKDINPDLGSGIYEYDPVQIVKSNNILYFTGNDGTHGYELWKSDGTETGTVLVKDIYPGGDESGPYSSSPNRLTDVAGTLFFTAWVGDHGELWKSDGTEAGTVLIKEIPIGQSPDAKPVAVGDVLYFPGYEEQHGCELWKSDGSEAGTVLVKDIDPYNQWCPSNLVDHSGKLYFAANDGVHGTELWTSDGTLAGTQMVKDISPGEVSSAPSYLTGLNGELYFSAWDEVAYSGLWKSDGTEAGTLLIKNINPNGNGDVSKLTAFNGELYFSADDGVHGQELWKSNGTEAGTVLVKDILTGALPWDDYDYLGPSNFNIAGDKLFFTANDGTHGREFWKSDGTDAGTLLVKDINTDSNSIYIETATVIGDSFFFTTYSGTIGTELWVSDGTQAGTSLVMRFQVGGFPTPSSVASYHDQIYFAADDGIRGAELWRSDGTHAGTWLVADINPVGSSQPTGMTVFKDTLYFSADDGTHGAELWKSDGAQVGTSLVKDIKPDYSGSGPANLVEVDGTLYFAADDGIHGYELWKSDGSQAGTQLVKDIYPGWISSGPSYLKDFNGTLVFIAGDDMHGIELWKSDGTEAGTTLIKNITPNEPDYLYAYPRELTPVQNTLYFVANDGLHGTELWKSDGTEDGTMLVSDINPNIYNFVEPIGSNPRFLTNASDLLFFTADDGSHGIELWKSDGSETGTVLVSDINPGTVGSREDFAPTNLAAINSVVFLGANDGMHGLELWKSDGTEAGTIMIADICPQADECWRYNGSKPTWLTDVNGTLFFLADDGSHGRELWAYRYIVSREYLPMLIR